MQYIWEYFQNDKRFDNRICHLKYCSPYMEISEAQINDGERIYYNAFFRYGNIIRYLYEIAKTPETFSLLFDVCSRILIEIDLKNELSVEHFERTRILNNILENVYGGEKLKDFMELNTEEQYKIVHSIWLAEKSGQKNIYQFADAVVTNLNTGIMYADIERPDRVIVYVGKEKNRKDEKIIQILSYFLLPIEYSYIILWEQHFGILEAENLMKIEKFVLI